MSGMYESCIISHVGAIDRCQNSVRMLIMNTGDSSMSIVEPYLVYVFLDPPLVENGTISADLLRSILNFKCQYAYTFHYIPVVGSKVFKVSRTDVYHLNAFRYMIRPLSQISHSMTKQTPLGATVHRRMVLEYTHAYPTISSFWTAKSESLHHIAARAWRRSLWMKAVLQAV